MGMLGHAVEIMIVSRNAEPLTLDYWLENEEYLNLSEKTDLFVGVSDTAELLERIPYGFRYPFGKDVDVRGFLEAFDFDEEYAQFEEEAQNIPLKSIISVVLMSTINREYGEHSYEYTWVKYNLPTNKATTGTGFGESVFDADRYLKSLISVEGEELSTSVPGEAPVKKAVTTSSFDWEAYYEGLQKKGEQWLQTYGDIFEPNPVITFSSKTFVLSGTEVMDRQYKISVEKEIESRGGVVRKNVSGKTDYLVVDPRGAGEAKVKNALEQQKKGKPVKVVTGVDFLAAIQMPVEQEDAHEPTPVKPADGRQESTSCNKAEPKPEATKTAVQDFKISADGVLEKYRGNETYVAVPAGIRKIGTSAFWCKGLKTVIIPEGVEAIGEQAFECCVNLEEVVLPDSLRTIGKNAFGECKSIKHIIIPDGVAHIERDAFKECNSLTSITLPDSLQSIKTDAFWGCSNLREIRIPNLVEEIGERAFFGCSNLERVNIPDRVSVIADLLFTECGSLEKIDIPDSVTSIGKDAFSDCTSLTSVTIPNTVTTIGARAFDGCVQLERVTLPDTLTSIGERVFHKCRKLSSITIPDSVESIGERAFHDCVSLGNVRIPSGVTQMGALCFFGCENLEYAVVTKGNCAEQYFAEEGIECRFEGEDAHTQPSRQRPAEVFLINQNGVFYGYFGSSTSVVLPNSVKTLGPHCGFSDNVRGVIIPDSVTSIGDFAFQNCSALKEIIIPDSVTAIGKYAFSGCTGLEKVVISKGITSVEDCAFENCSALKEIIIPDSVTAIGEYAFYGCTGLEKVVISKGITSVEDYAFENCSALKEIIIPDSVTAIGCWAFIGCDNLTIIAPEGSYAQEFSESNWISFRIDDTEKKRKAEEEAERMRKAAEEAERKRQEELIAKRTRYDELSAAISLQLQIISQNKGWFGIQAKSRKTAQQQLAKLQEQLETEFPEGKP